MYLRRFVVVALTFLGVLHAGDARLVNLSSRVGVGTGDNVLISGFVIGAGSNKTVLVRAVGPSLSGQGVAGALGDPILSLYNNSGTLLVTNDNWNAADAAIMASVGAFQLPTGSKDAAIVRTLAPGPYTAVVNGAANTTGVSLIEVYETDGASGRLVNLSTRAFIGAGDNLLISGLVVSGSGTRRLLVRAVGPTLANVNVKGVLADPILNVVNASTHATISTNDNWETPNFVAAVDSATIAAVSAIAGAFPLPAGSKDAALIADFPPGLYGVNVTGAGNTTGVALVEVYDVTVESPIPIVSVYASQPSSDESGNKLGEFTFYRTGGDASQPLTVSYTIGGTATFGSDYIGGIGSVVFPSDVVAMKISIAPKSDLLIEGTETAVFTLIDGGGAYKLGSVSSATVNIVDVTPTLYVSTLRPVSTAGSSTASGTATILLSSDGTYASVSLEFSNLSSPETVAYLRFGNPGEVGVELLRMPNGQVDGTNWNIRASGALTASDILQGLKDGHVFVRIESSSFPGGELSGTFALGNGSQTFVTPAAPPAIDLNVISDTDAARFLTQATFGPTKADVDALKQKGYSTWLTEQLAKAPSLHRDAVMSDFAANNAGGQNAVEGVNTRPGQIHRQAAWWKIALTGDDQLRQRVAFALSEIFVISDVNGTVYNSQEGTANYYDILVRGGLGNFRKLLEDVTLSPMMGVYLSHLRNAKSTSPTGAQPDENYAREVMQLFTIGLSQLQPDGTLKLDARALPTATYDQTTVTEMAKVFTGWGFYNTNPTTNNFRNSPSNYIDPMTLYSGWHDTNAKTIVGGTQLPAGRSGTDDLKDTLDALFNHPNTGPFISRQLIQRLVTSNPSPAYVYRVAQVFANNGAGVRGDLAAVVRAILTDYEARSSAVSGNAGSGKLKEPLLRVTGLLRAAGFSSSTGRYAISNANAQLGEAALSAPTVFNFFEPDFVQPGNLANAGLIAPEFQILTATTAMSVPNYLYSFLFNNTYQGVSLTYADLVPLASTSGPLVDRLGLLLAGNGLPTETRTRIVTALDALPASTSATDRVRNALYLVTTTPDGAVQR